MAIVKIMTDTASDISIAQASKYDIELMNFWLVLGEETFRENEKYSTKEFYNLLDSSDEMPHTSQITVIDYVERYKKMYENGVTDLIVVAIASIGSNSYYNAVLARDEFFEEDPSLKDKIKITIIDSKSYTGGYGLPVIEAAKKVQNGCKADEIIAFLEDWADSAVIICTAYTLKYAKKSGRVSGVAAFVGEALGLKPLIVFIDAVSKTVAKIRGEKAVIPALVNKAIETMVPQTPYVVLNGSREELTAEVIESMEKQIGYPPTEILQIGATIACHLGHEVSGIIVKGEKRIYK